jgi:hypothetical protein
VKVFFLMRSAKKNSQQEFHFHDSVNKKKPGRLWIQIFAAAAETGLNGDSFLFFEVGRAWALARLFHLYVIKPKPSPDIFSKLFKQEKAQGRCSKPQPELRLARARKKSGPTHLY